MLDHPARDAGPERAFMGEDQLGETVTGDDRSTDAGDPIHPVDRQRVVGHDDLDRVGDQLEDAGRLERRQQLLVHIEQAPLALELELQFGLLPVQSVQVLGVDHGLHGGGGEDRQGHLIVDIEAISTERGHDDDPADHAIPDHGHDQHRLGVLAAFQDQASWIIGRIAQTQRAAVRRDPAGEPSTDRRPQAVEVRLGAADEAALERHRLAHAGFVVDAIDADRIVLDQTLGFRHDGPCDRLRVVKSAESAAQLCDR